ncbi:MAG: M23 family metallopeptidase [Ruminococcaceae bacterium]|nr:M23 family metallopeptidase [Oscillospiraceae bacterium]
MPPTAEITVSGKTENIAPFEMSWNYRKCDGNFRSSDVMHFTSAKIPLYDYSPDGSTVEIEFELVPDAVSVQIFDGADSVYSGKYGSEEYKSFTYNRKTKLEYIFTAEWYESSSARYHGKAIYKADVNYILTPVGLASSTRLENGEFTVLSIYNTARDEQLTLENGTAEFYENDGVKLMYCSDSNKDTQQQITLTVTDQSGNKITQFVQTEPVKSTLAFELHESIPDQLYTADYATPSPSLKKVLEAVSVSDGKMWNEKFEQPVEYTDALISFGTPLTKNGENTGYSCFILAKSDTQDVKSMGNGKAVFAGELGDYGKTIIIDHGIGIFTFYSNLDSLCVSSGDFVSKSDVIAKLNIQSGAALQYGVLAGGRFVDPQKLNTCLEAAGLV